MKRLSWLILPAVAIAIPWMSPAQKEEKMTKYLVNITRTMQVHQCTLAILSDTLQFLTSLQFLNIYRPVLLQYLPVQHSSGNVSLTVTTRPTTSQCIMVAIVAKCEASLHTLVTLWDQIYDGRISHHFCVLYNPTNGTSESFLVHPAAQRFKYKVALDEMDVSSAGCLGCHIQLTSRCCCCCSNGGESNMYQYVNYVPRNSVVFIDWTRNLNKIKLKVLSRYAMEDIVSWLGFTADYINGLKGVSLEEGLWNRKVDISLTTAMVSERMSKVDYTSSPLDISHVIFSVKRPKVHFRLSTLLLPFTFPVWVTLAATFVIVVVVFTIRYRCKRWPFRVLIPPLMDQGGARVHPDIILAMWYLFCLVMGTVYKGRLVSLLNAPGSPDDDVPRSFRQLSTSDYKWGGAQPKTGGIARILEAIQEPYMATVVRGWKAMHNTKSCLARTLQDRFVCITTDVLRPETFPEGFFGCDGQLRFISVVPDDGVFVATAIAVRKDSLYLDTLSRSVMNFQASGFPNHRLALINILNDLRIHSFVTRGGCSGDLRHMPSQSWNLKKLQVAFAALIAGLSSGFGILIVELVTKVDFRTGTRLRSGVVVIHFRA